MDLESKVNQLTSLVEAMSVTITNQANAIANISNSSEPTKLSTPKRIQRTSNARSPATPSKKQVMHTLELVDTSEIDYIKVRAGERGSQ